MLCRYCKKDHPNGVTAKMVAAGHPYAIDAGRGTEERRYNAQPAALCGERHPTKAGVSCMIAVGHAPVHVGHWGIEEWG